MEQKRCSDLTPDNFIISSPAYCLPEAPVTYHTRGVSRMCPNSEPVRELIHVCTHRQPAPLSARKQLQRRQHAVQLCNHIKLLIRRDRLAFLKIICFWEQSSWLTETLDFDKGWLKVFWQSNCGVLQSTTWTPVTSRLDWFIFLPAWRRCKALRSERMDAAVSDTCIWSYLPCKHHTEPQGNLKMDLLS